MLRRILNTSSSECIHIRCGILSAFVYRFIGELIESQLSEYMLFCAIWKNKRTLSHTLRRKFDVNRHGMYVREWASNTNSNHKNSLFRNNIIIPRRQRRCWETTTARKKYTRTYSHQQHYWCVHCCTLFSLCLFAFILVLGMLFSHIYCHLHLHRRTNV